MDAMDGHETPRATVSLTTCQEKTLLRPAGSRRHAVFTLRAGMEQAEQAPQVAPVERRPLALALTLDRSGSMSGLPLRMAKQVALSLVNGMTEEDELVVVAFDSEIDIVQERARVSPEVKGHIRRALEQIEARSSTALHEAWLTSCNLLASDQLQEGRLARCYLLTDGQANVGETDVETIAAQAAGVRENAGVSTSAFGLGDHYNELLLGPWAMAGGGQFHDLRSTADLAGAFLGERDDLRTAVALHARLEVELPEGMSAESISAYWRAGGDAQPHLWRLDIGDLLNGEERRVVVRFSFPKTDRAYSYTARARVVWMDDRGEQVGGWQEITFTSGSDQACEDEPRDPEAMRWIGLAHADRTKRQALELAARHETDMALLRIQETIVRIHGYANGDPELRAAMDELRRLSDTIRERKLTSRISKDTYYTAQTRSRSQKDYRSGER